MAEIVNLESVAKLLPKEQREQFYLIVQKYKTVPQDDDHLVMLDAMGFIALFMNELPRKIGKLLDQAGQRLTEDQATALGNQFSEILQNSLDVPNYQDMTKVTRDIRETYQKSEAESRKLNEKLRNTHRQIAKYSRLSPVIGTSITTSLITLTLGAVAAFFWLPKLLDKPITVPKRLWPYVELEKERRLDYIDKTHPDSVERKIRILKIKDGVLDAFVHGDEAVVVLERPEDELSN